LFNQTCKDSVFRQKAITQIIHAKNSLAKSKYRTILNILSMKRQSGRVRDSKRKIQKEKEKVKLNSVIY
jgi:hypothetical protein